MKRNSKGFVLIETLIVTVFAIGIITLLYVSITPMVAQYDDMTRRDSNIDIVYKLFHIRKMLYKEKIELEDNIKKITCSDLTKQDYCHTLLNYLDIDKYNLYYIKEVSDSLSYQGFDQEISNYLKKYPTDNNILLLEDLDNHLIVHLKYR